MTHLIVHYHLRSGGVSRVIEHEMSYLRQMQVPHHLFSATPLAEETPHDVMAELDYDPAPACIDASELAMRLLQRAALVSDSIDEPRIWHVHNPLLGCHPAFTAAMRLLLERGERMIWHLHDFAEDQRSAQLAAVEQQTKRFARAAHLHYITLSQRDAAILRRAGLPATHCHVLPPPVACQPAPSTEETEPLILYPTRAIERKNLAELVLLAALLPKPYRIATTQRPTHPRWQAGHAFWESLAQQLQLPLSFGVVSNGQRSFRDWVSRSRHLLNTSQQEGFGLIFLEAIAWQKPLIGRDIPHISADLAARQIHHPGLYQQLHHRDHDEEFCRLPRERQAALIATARQEPHAFYVTQRQQRHLVLDWWDDVLSSNSMPHPALLSPYSIENHGSALCRIAADLACQATSSVEFLCAETVKSGFAAVGGTSPHSHD